MTSSVDLKVRERRPAHTIPQDLVAFLRMQGYRELRLVGAGVCGLHRFNFTMGLVVGLTFEGYERRYCYRYQKDARSALATWDGHEHPGGPWIKCKGAGIDLLNPALIA
ncbi:hypothetical protein C1I89_29880 [Achromobacter pulmonis]|uniref:Uncharacterized protein n=1 Tax=Achromobacter pulmonis TaxID=1389932 RepID=A0A2N8K9Q0_9BURK|nr:hypothetical protein [Achromobacter pulmonis]PND30180.1 hypothetical protein C1I89_29880 [Achromobacter pulmonis]